MKYRRAFTLAFLVSLFSVPSFSQTFQVLATDKAGDGQFAGYDIKSLSYAVDKANDKLWFRVESVAQLGGDFGFAIGIDNDNTLTNGRSWGGSNKSMNYDLVIFIDRDVIDTTIIYGGVETGPDRPTGDLFEPRVIDNHTVEVGLQLSQIAPNGYFNVIAGDGGFDVASTGQTFDDVPDKSYVTVNLLAGVAGNTSVKSVGTRLHPNPASGWLFVDGVNDDRISLADVTGREVRTEGLQTPAGLKISVRSLPRGFYILTYHSDDRIVREKLEIR